MNPKSKRQSNNNRDLLIILKSLNNNYILTCTLPYNYYEQAFVNKQKTIDVDFDYIVIVRKII